MADISMCLNHDCPRRLECYRYTAPVNPEWQCYNEYRVDAGSNQCGWFVDNGRNRGITWDKPCPG